MGLICSEEAMSNAFHAVQARCMRFLKTSISGKLCSAVTSNYNNNKKKNRKKKTSLSVLTALEKRYLFKWPLSFTINKTGVALNSKN